MLNAIIMWLGFWGGLAGAFAILAAGNTNFLPVSQVIDSKTKEIFTLVKNSEKLFFGERLFSIKAFIRSMSMSAVSLCFILFVYIILFSRELDYVHIGLDFYTVALLGTILPDFLSVQITRYIIRSIDSTFRATLGLFTDFILSIILSFAGIISFGITASIVGSDFFLQTTPTTINKNSPMDIGRLFSPNMMETIEVLFFIIWPTGMLTSVWLWAFLLGWLVNFYILKSTSFLRIKKNVDVSTVGCAFIAIVGLPLIVIGYTVI